MILIGGQALVFLGSTRGTEDRDYLVYNEKSTNVFDHDDDNHIDYINAACSDFFKEIYDLEKGNRIATPQSLLELKAYAFVMHCQNMNWQKADDCEFDMRFLVRSFGLTEIKIVNKYLAASEIKEIEKIIKSTRV